MEPTWTSDCGKVRLWLGDCRDIIGTLTADAVVTDPPYGISFAARPTKWQRLAGHTPQDWDDERPGVHGLLTFDVVVVWGGNYFDLPTSRGWLAWTKPDAPPSMASIELAWTNRDMNARQISHSISATNAERVGHPTQKPLRVMLWCLEQASVPNGALVLDPFMGSGTTGVACIRTGRRFLGIEKDPRYFEIAKRRIQDELTRTPLFDAAPALETQPVLFEGH